MGNIAHKLEKDKVFISGLAPFFHGRPCWGKAKTNFVYHDYNTQKIFHPFQTTKGKDKSLDMEQNSLWLLTVLENAMICI